MWPKLNPTLNKIKILFILSNDNEEDELQIKEEVNASSIQSTKENEEEIEE